MKAQVPIEGNPGWVALEPAEQPKVDPYEAHRLKLEASGVPECDVRVLTSAEQPGATARLHAGLEGEKVRERVRAFPKAGRNFALKGGGDG